MKPISEIPDEVLSGLRAVLTDIDDTLTNGRMLPAAAYAAMEALRAAGVRVVPITGRPAGWCDHIARMWPVDGVVGENGALYYRYDDARRVMVRRYFRTDAERARDRERLMAIRDRVLAEVPGVAVSADQAFRDADLAIDFCEDVAPVGDAAVAEVVRIFTAAGAVAKVSSIHVNGWFGDYDKLRMTRRFFAEVFGEDLETVRDAVIFTGDSPNDEPMFAAFPNAVGVANVREFAGTMRHLPRYVTTARGGDGFAELATHILRVRRTAA